MNSLKTLLGATLLAALAYGVYLGITKKPATTSHIDGPKIKPGVLAKDDIPALPVEPAGSARASNADEEAPAFEPGVPAESPSEAVTVPASEDRYADVPYSEDGPPPPVTTEATHLENSVDAVEPPSENVTPVSATSSTSESGIYAQEMPSIEQQLHAGQLAEAHLALSKLYGHSSLTPEENVHVTELLSQLAGTVIYSRQHLLAPPHRAVPGETLEQVATACNVPWQLLAKINGLSGGGQLQPGQELKIIPGPFHAVVDLDEKQLVLFLNGERYAGRFPIAIGADHAPQPGQHHVVQNKLLNPSYYDTTRVYTPEDPQNPLGTRKIELDQQVSIHGTSDPTSLDRDDPRGCIRMNPRDIEDVYDILTIGSEVAVRR